MDISTAPPAFSELTAMAREHDVTDYAGIVELMRRS
jgi:hypothetical protein